MGFNHHSLYGHILTQGPLFVLIIIPAHMGFAQGLEEKSFLCILENFYLFHSMHSYTRIFFIFARVTWNKIGMGCWNCSCSHLKYF